MADQKAMSRGTLERLIKIAGWEARLTISLFMGYWTEDYMDAVYLGESPFQENGNYTREDLLAWIELDEEMRKWTKQLTEKIARFLGIGIETVAVMTANQISNAMRVRWIQARNVSWTHMFHPDDAISLNTDRAICPNCHNNFYFFTGNNTRYSVGLVTTPSATSDLTCPICHHEAHESHFPLATD